MCFDNFGNELHELARYKTRKDHRRLQASHFTIKLSRTFVRVVFCGF